MTHEIIFHDAIMGRGYLTNENDANDYIYFPHNPVGRARNKSAVYEQTKVPGLSDPLMQFICGGLDTISFTLILTDNAFCSVAPAFLAGAATGIDSLPVPSKTGRKYGLNSKTGIQQDTTQGWGDSPPDFRSATIVAWLRSKLVPVRKNNRTQSSPPALNFSLGEEFARVKISEVGDEIKKYWPDGKIREISCDVKLFHAIKEHRNPADLLKRY